MPRLPQELLDIIVDNIYEDENDIADLKSCSLAARAFVSSARRHIFRKIEILPPRSSCNPCQRFYRLINSSPHIAALVEELCIVLVGSETSSEFDEDGEFLQKRRVTWVMEGRTLSLVLPLLDLRRISLTENVPVDWNGWGEFSMNWPKMGRKLKSALKNVFSSPTLEAVHLRGIVIESPRELLSLFSETTSLKELSLSRLYFTQRGDLREAWSESQLWRPQLRSLLIAELQSETFSRFVVNPRIDLTRLSSLTLSTSSTLWREEVVRAMGGLEHLSLQVNGVMGEGLFGVNLRSIHLSSSLVIRLLRLFFEACPHDSRLEYLTLEGDIGVTTTTGLDASVESTVAQLHSLTTVEIKLRSESFHRWAEALRDALPSLERRSLLRVTEVPWPDLVHHGWE